MLANIEYTDTMLTVVFENQANKDLPRPKFEVPTSSSRGDDSDWRFLVESPFEVLVSARHRQDSDEEWEVVGADWVIEFYTPTGENYMSSFFNMDSKTMEGGFWANS